ncbi:hypothetical protein VNO77_19326 [Canavalia gladiata]|uniref:Uncharacterized protein n=1 Tax=Canavalia gladiata TaxID=3824 RepID=A0AAN9LMI3_CANGL
MSVLASPFHRGEIKETFTPKSPHHLCHVHSKFGSPSEVFDKLISNHLKLKETFAHLVNDRNRPDPSFESLLSFSSMSMDLSLLCIAWLGSYEVFSVGTGFLKELETLKVSVVGGEREGYS